jgi:hypothetical protein
MPQPPADADPLHWHRYFAMQGNNRAWDLAVQARATAADRELLDAAHASAWHWRVAGTEQNHMRSAMLLAEVHSLLGHGATALSYANEMHAWFLARPDTPDWEMAFAHAILAHAAHAAGDHALHVRSYRDASASLAAIADPEDRAIVQQTFQQVPAP